MGAPMATDITCIVNVHNEGILAHRTLKSAARSCAFAQAAGRSTEILVIADRMTDDTAALLRDYWGNVRIVQTDFGEPAQARNAGVSEASGSHIAFLDGDDMISTNWLNAAFNMSQQDEKYVLHPAMSIFFDLVGRILHHPNQPPGPFHNGAIAFDNFWSALSFAPRATYLKVPYAKTVARSGFGFEDWQFNCEAIAAGYRHRVVKETVHFIRVKGANGVSQRNAADGAIMRHSAYFSQMADATP